VATTSAIRIGPADHGRTMTLEGFRQAEEEEGYRYELGRGILEVNEIPDDAHGMVVWRHYCLLVPYHQAHPEVIRRFGGAGEFQLWLPGLVSIRSPDVAVVLEGTPKNLRSRRPPSLAVEVVSPGGEVRDYQTKREEYLAYGLLEYWIVDPAERKVTVLTRDGDVWREQVFRGEQPVASVVLPGFAPRVEEFWAGVDEDEADEPEGA
jgi:Uma2 family endonuclease